MNALHVIAVALILWPLGLTVVSRAQDPDLEERYEQALQVAESKDFEQAYELSAKLVRSNSLFYEANVLRIALATVLKKTGPEDPKNLLDLFKKRAPAGSKPENDVREMVNRLINPSAAIAETSQPASKPKDAVPPKIVITSPSAGRGQGVRLADNRSLKQEGNRITVAGQVTDESGVSEVTVRGVTAQIDERGNFLAEVSLPPDGDPIIVTATDRYGNRATERFIIQRESKSSLAGELRATVAGRYFALVIGNNRYPNLPLDKQLKTAINDAQEVAGLLRSDYGFQTALMTDGNRAEIINALYEYRNRLKPDDSLLIYYAGHGHFDSETGKGYWIPSDAKLTSPANWIIADEVTVTIKGIAARHILIVSDSCYSGTLMRGGDFGLSMPTERERYLEKVRSGISRILMASGGNEPVADGGGSGHSVFARAFLDGLHGMKEQVFAADELFQQYIKERVAGKSNQMPQYNPLLNSGHESGDFVFVRVK